MAGIAFPFVIGNVEIEIEDGSHVKGLVCEISSLGLAEDISGLGGW